LRISLPLTLCKSTISLQKILAEKLQGVCALTGQLANGVHFNQQRWPCASQLVPTSKSKLAFGRFTFGLPFGEQSLVSPKLGSKCNISDIQVSITAVLFFAANFERAFCETHLLRISN
jgi:hypothetical protein